jgi:hypothetical protein
MRERLAACRSAAADKEIARTPRAETVKVIQAHGEMSNLVGKWANTNDGKMTVFIYGKADATRFMVQGISALSGEPNVIRLFTLDQMMDWNFYANPDIAVDEIIHFHETGRYRYRFPDRAENSKEAKK